MSSSTVGFNLPQELEAGLTQLRKRMDDMYVQHHEHKTAQNYRTIWTCLNQTQDVIANHSSPAETLNADSRQLIITKAAELVKLLLDHPCTECEKPDDAAALLKRMTETKEHLKGLEATWRFSFESDYEQVHLSVASIEKFLPLLSRCCGLLYEEESHLRSLGYHATLKPLPSAPPAARTGPLNDDKPRLYWSLSGVPLNDSCADLPNPFVGNHKKSI